MTEMILKKHSRYFFIALFLFIIGLSIFLIWPFMTAILGGIVLSYVFYPIYKRLLRIIKNKHIASFIMSILLLVILSIPFIFVANTLLNESLAFFHTVRTLDIEQIS